MGNIGDPISTTVPSVGASGPGYAVDIKALLDEFKLRLESRIPLSSLLANAAFDLDGQAIRRAGLVEFVNQTGASGLSNSLSVYGGDLWFTGVSTPVQITDGNKLASSSLGGITGDYSGLGPMQFRYDAANTRYDAFSNQPSGGLAYVRARGFDVAAGATSSLRARLLFSGPANVSYTLPPAPPSATSTLQMDPDGKIRATNEAADKRLSYSAAIAQSVGGAGHSVGGTSTSAIYTVVSSTGVTVFPLQGMREGMRVKAITVYATSTAEPGISIQLQQSTGFGALTTTSTGNIVPSGVRTLTLTTPNTINGQGDFMRVLISASAQPVNVYAFEVLYDIPS